MNLISCSNCAVVLDKRHIHVTNDLYSKQDGSVNLEDYEWFAGKYVPIYACPVCQEPIRINDDDL